jgi:hypothetical protein
MDRERHPGEYLPDWRTVRSQDREDGRIDVGDDRLLARLYQIHALPRHKDIQCFTQNSGPRKRGRRRR